MCLYCSWRRKMNPARKKDAKEERGQWLRPLSLSSRLDARRKIPLWQTSGTLLVKSSSLTRLFRLSGSDPIRRSCWFDCSRCNINFVKYTSLIFLSLLPTSPSSSSSSSSSVSELATSVRVCCIQEMGGCVRACVRA